MVDTTTTNYGFTKPQNAGSDDTWGDKTNTNWDLADAAMKAISDQVAPGTEPARQHTTGHLHLLGVSVPSNATMTLAASTAYLIPVCQMVKATALTFDNSASGAGSSARVSLYASDAKGMPSTLVETLTGTIDLNGPAANPVASFAAARTLEPSQWICFHTNGSLSGAGVHICGVLDPLEASRLFGITAGAGLSLLNAPSTFMGLSKALAFGSIAADPFPTTSLAAATQVPMIWAVAS